MRPLRDWRWYAAPLALAGDKLWVAGYLEADYDNSFQYGDLVVGTYDGTKVNWTIVDGVPDLPERVHIRGAAEVMAALADPELLPPLEPDGTSHLWEALGRKFTDMSYAEADVLSKKNKEFIKGLFPEGVVYASLFPKDAQDVIGKVGAQTRGVEKMLRRIGFRYADRVDPFDGGPHFFAATEDIQPVKETRQAKITGRLPDVLATGEPSDGVMRSAGVANELVGNELPGFRNTPPALAGNVAVAGCPAGSPHLGPEHARTTDGELASSHGTATKATRS